VAAAAVVVSVLLVLSSLPHVGSSAFVLSVGAAIAVVGVASGVRRSRRVLGRVDVFHPLIFPLSYAAVSFLAPAWYVLVEKGSIFGFTADRLSEHTALLLTLALAGLALGLALPLRQAHRRPPATVDPATLRRIGRVLLVALVVVRLVAVVTGAVQHRGVGQTVYGIESALAAFSDIMTPLAVLLLVLPVGLGFQRGTVGTVLDFGLILTLGGLDAAVGERGSLLVIVIMSLYAATRRASRLFAVLGGFLGALLVGVLILRYRSASAGVSANRSAIESIIADWGVATYTTGATALRVPELQDLSWGATYVVSVVRQLPSPLANAILGPPYDTGTYVFRDLIGFVDPDQGLAFSLPAEGYLNFGVFGVLAACFTFGAFCAWSYQQARWPINSVLACLYPIVVATMPVTIRSDALGMLKQIMYPMIVAALAIGLARMSARTSDPSTAQSSP